MLRTINKAQPNFLKSNLITSFSINSNLKFNNYISRINILKNDYLNKLSYLMYFGKIKLQNLFIYFITTHKRKKIKMKKHKTWKRWKEIRNIKKTYLGNK